MKLINSLYLSLFVFLIIGCKTSQTAVTTDYNPSTFEKLASMEHVVSIEKKDLVSHFDENYEIWFEQPIDYNNLSKGTFRQRVLLGFENPTQPVIVELHGYGIGSGKAGELANHYKANQINIEHRYFNNSRPENIDWNTLTVENAAKDQARIIDAIRKALYPNTKFISTGISKGCQTTMLHRRYFPENVDACVCYVGPLNFEREDPRVYEFLNNVSTQENRDKVKAFQELCFENRASLLEMMKAAGKEKDMSWEFGVDKAIDYTILEYSFAFWQWGTPIESIPAENATAEEIYNHLISVVGYGFFEEKAVEGLQPYFWAALTQQGIYGYETAPFKEYLNTEEIYKFEWAFPEGITKEFDPVPMQEIQTFLDNSAEDMLFIYGEYDAWSATAVELEDDASKREVYKFVQPKGSHTTRIKSFSPETQKEIYDIIDGWLKE
ncbi:S28 family serine protease [Xanthomarina spongicola]|uniref:PS-10 peptidase S37 n=1 Tax=Xanthomarina spongicola TaxID=570520 RepID=A0A316DJH1_9FLAO|nr:S28 family serine protease [Xanthomarina spongicola]PWK18271.1 PS-10 peptidase S37 [Xanthomarina spongicola]